MRPPETVTKTDFTRNLYNRYVATKEALSKKENFTYREIIAISSFQALEGIKSTLEKELFNYQVKCYEALSPKSPPLLTFLIIDSKEVIVAAYRHPYLDTEGEIRLSIRHPDITKLFEDYYNTIWQGARLIKEGNTIDMLVLDSMYQQLSQAGSKKKGKKH